MVTPSIFCTGYSATRSAAASTHLPPKYPSRRGVTQDFAKSFSGQHEQPNYVLNRTANIYMSAFGGNGPASSWMTGPLRSVNTTGPPALMTVGFGAVMMSVPRLSSRAEMPITAIKNAVTSPTATILRWVDASALYIDQFIGSSALLLFVR